MLSELDTDRSATLERSPTCDNLSQSNQPLSMSSLTLPQPKQREAQMREIDELEKSEHFNKADIIHMLREKETEIDTLLEEMAIDQSQRMETQDALSEAQTIIEELHDQLNVVRLRAAQCETDIENLKLKSLFLSKQGNDDKAAEQHLYDLCEQLDAEVKDLRKQLGQSGRVQISLENQNEYLKRQLQNHGLSRSASPSPSAEESGFVDSQLSVPQRMLPLSQRQLHQHYEELQRRMVELEEKHREEINTYEQELDRLNAEMDSWKSKEQEWHDIHQTLLEQQEDLNEELKAKNKKIDRMSRRKNKTPTGASSDVSCPQDDQDANHEELIHRITEERDRWKAYACALVRTIVENCDEFIDKTSYDEPDLSTTAERRWYNYAIYLLEILLEVAPQRLTEMDVQLLRRRRSASCPPVSSNSIFDHGFEGPDILSAVNIRTIATTNRLTLSERVARMARKPIFRAKVRH
ncbi:hypothetical protein T265_03879 [Opisthorchis viverrini]|uniref:Uncharacterized protein n=1 Tax=Opisthorchis viverrini TaxID=6198 RepID=A0A074ZUI0_OPIVI|nr:hypothetical protein T265_03879 [Opisthorchis viverrini]KER29502.1 hypothetical protein T265_03879 [Opisthorchis viverrini]